MPDLDTRDLEGRTYSIRCIVCGWKFRCPVERIGRQYCFACESKVNAAQSEKTR